MKKYHYIPLFYHTSLSRKMIGRGQGYIHKKEITSVWMKIRTNMRFLQGEIMYEEQRITSLMRLKWFPEAEAFPHIAGGKRESNRQQSIKMLTKTLKSLKDFP